MEKFVKFLLFCWVILAGGPILNAKPNQPPEYLTYVNEVTRQFEKEMKKEFGLLCIGSGGSMPHDVEEIDVRFVAYRKVTIEQARQLLVLATQKLLNVINNDEKIRPFLREYPFKVPRAKVAISFRKKGSNEPYMDGSVSFVFQVRNRVFYKAEDPKTPNYIDLAEEPYEEALKKVQSGQ